MHYEKASYISCSILPALFCMLCVLCEHRLLVYLMLSSVWAVSVSRVYLYMFSLFQHFQVLSVLVVLEHFVWPGLVFSLASGLGPALSFMRSRYLESPLLHDLLSSLPGNAILVGFVNKSITRCLKSESHSVAGNAKAQWSFIGTHSKCDYILTPDVLTQVYYQCVFTKTGWFCKKWFVNKGTHCWKGHSP